MKYISDRKKLEIIKEKAQKGDKKAKDFLFNFMNMPDDEVNEYLASVEEITINPNDSSIVGIIGNLIEEEKKAVESYDNALKFFTHTSHLNEEWKNKVVDTLEHIKSEEEEHIKELKGVLEWK